MLHALEWLQNHESQAAPQSLHIILDSRSCMVTRFISCSRLFLILFWKYKLRSSAPKNQRKAPTTIITQYERKKIFSDKFSSKLPFPKPSIWLAGDVVLQNSTDIVRIVDSQPMILGSFGKMDARFCLMRILGVEFMKLLFMIGSFLRELYLGRSMGEVFASQEYGMGMGSIDFMGGNVWYFGTWNLLRVGIDNKCNVIETRLHTFHKPLAEIRSMQPLKAATQWNDTSLSIVAHSHSQHMAASSEWFHMPFAS